MHASIVPVLVPVPVEGPFDYRWQRAGEAVPGTYVEVPFGRRRLIGVVWDEASPQRSPAGRLKSVERTFDFPPLPFPLRALIRAVAREHLAPLGSVLRLVLSTPSAFDAETERFVLALAEPLPPLRLTPARRRVVELLRSAGPLTAAEILERAGTGSSVLRGLSAAGALQRRTIADPDRVRPTKPVHRPLPLTPGQRRIAQRLRAMVAAGGHEVALLEGVPGSGKTEVYFEAVAEALERGGRVLVLLPEIALSAQWLGRFRQRFGVEPAVWHSGLTAARRRRLWRRIARGLEPVVVGARSALFLPLSKPGLVIVDEEQDSSFKQEEGVGYDARTAALLRGRLEDCPVLLVSATPSVDSAYRCGRIPEFRPSGEPWRHFRLDARHGGARMPEIALVDLRRERPPPAAWLAPPLRRALESCFSAGEQALLFLNRRGYAPLTLCRACGHRLRCPNCSAWLVTHRLRHRLQCHHCGWNRPEPEHCPHCGTLDMLAACGPGVERIAEEAQRLFPDRRIRVVTSDTLRTARQAAELMDRVVSRQVDLLVGTQILAKGHHFPALTLVGVVDADLGLAGGDLRAAERCFQLLYQVAGRAGRETRPGRVLIQTHLPDHPVMQALLHGDQEGFLRAELAERKEAGMPPFGRLAALILSGRDAEEVRAEARRLARRAPAGDDIRVLGPAPAPITLLRGRYRERLLVKAGPAADLPAYLRRWLAGVRMSGTMRLRVDVDPQSFL